MKRTPVQISEFVVDAMKGLTEAEVLERIKRDGPNELPSQKRRNIIAIFLSVLKEPMLLLLVTCGAIYLFLGEPDDAVMLVSFVFVVICITFYQERKTERTLEALRDLSSPRALVIRGGEQKRIAGRDVVVDDIIVLKEGDRVPADAVVISCTNLSIDESLLTGEPNPVRKAEWDNRQSVARPGGDDLPFVYSGTLIVQGRGVARVTSVGIRTEIGKIGKALREIREEDTLLQKETRKLVRNFSITGGILCILVVLIYGLTRGDWLTSVLSGLTLSMAMLPEEFPVVLLIFLTLGAWRISKKNVLTRRTPAIETLGAATALCSDKTGTITQNAMSLTMLATDGVFHDVDTRRKRSLPEEVHGLVEYAILASQKDPFDPIERELKRVGEFYLSNSEHIHQNWKLVKEYPLSKQLLALSHVWASPDLQNYVIAAKGSPEAIIDLCHVDEALLGKIMSSVDGMARRGMRVLGVAKSVFRKRELPDIQHEFPFKFVGLLGFIDPVREAVPTSITEAHGAGMRVIMITGDYPATAVHIARQIGLKNPDACLTGAEMERMPRAALADRIRQINVFARVVPEQKLAIVEALKANGEIVAMTGDGVNDAPALKSAHIGIAMGGRGTDVAREAAALVLLDDDFSSIVAATRLGRRIYDNLKKAMAYIFAVHVPIAGMSFFPVLFGLPIALLPTHIAFLELIIDPACSTVFEACEENAYIMKRPPRRLSSSLFDRRSFVVSLLQGMSVLAVVLAVFMYELRAGRGEDAARTMSFIALVWANIMLILTNLSWSRSTVAMIRLKNSPLWIVVIGTLVALTAAVFWPAASRIFHFSSVSLREGALASACGISLLVWFEGLKTVMRRIRAS